MSIWDIAVFVVEVYLLLLALVCVVAVLASIGDWINRNLPL